MNITSSIEHFYKEVPSIPDDKNYWLIRTLSGELYETFISEDYIGIGYNEISLEAINNINRSSRDEGVAIWNIKNLVAETYTEDRRPGLIASQIYQGKLTLFV